MFKDRTAPKEKKGSKEFGAMDYDKRSGDAVAAGVYYGTGVRQPVGRMRGAPEKDAVPKKSQIKIKNLA